MGRTGQHESDFDCRASAANYYSETVQNSTRGNILPMQVAEQRLARLTRTIEGEIIPRLLLAHRVASPQTAVRKITGRPIADEDVTEFSRLIIEHDVSVAIAFVETLKAEGASLQSVFLELLSPAARRLGELWEQDICDFTQVTVGLSHLQQVLRTFSPAFENEDSSLPTGQRALLVPAPGEQHTFGLFMVEEFFRRDGWDVWGGLSVSHTELVEIIRKEWFEVIGFSISNVTLLEPFTRCLKELRDHSRNPDIAVMVGGKLMSDQPELVQRIGADLTADDGQQAVHAVERFLKSKEKVRS